MLAMNNTSSAIWASLAVLFAGCRVGFFFFPGLSNMFLVDVLESCFVPSAIAVPGMFGSRN